MDYYKILGVPRFAKFEEIRRSYKKLALKYHPDKNPERVPEANDRFRKIVEAFNVLGNEKKRQEYDRAARVDFNKNGSSHRTHEYARKPAAYPSAFRFGEYGFTSKKPQRVPNIQILPHSRSGSYEPRTHSYTFIEKNVSKRVKLETRESKGAIMTTKTISEPNKETIYVYKNYFLQSVFVNGVQQRFLTT